MGLTLIAETDKTKLCVIAGGSHSEFLVSLVITKFAVESILQLEDYKVSLFVIEQNFNVIECDPLRFLAETTTEDVFTKLEHEPNLYKKSLIQSGSIATVLAPAVEASDLVYPLMQGPLGECGAIQGFLKIFNKPFVSIGHLGSALCKDKEIQKLILQAKGLPIVPYKAFKNHEYFQMNYEEIARELGEVLILKPANFGSSVGIEYVTNRQEFISATERIFNLTDKIIIEKYIYHDEFEFYVFGSQMLRVQQPFEKMQKGKYISYKDKYFSPGRLAPPHQPDFAPEYTQELKEIASRAYQACECDLFARVDLFIDAKKNVYVNEINTIPALDVKNQPELFISLFNLAFNRFAEEQKYLKITF